MRFIITLAFALALFTSAYADEAVFELKKSDENAQPYMVSNSSVKFQTLTAAPDGATAPEGEVTWGSLKMGEYEYLVCMVLEEQTMKKFYFDRNRDKNLKDEKEAEIKKFAGQVQYAPLTDVEGKFTLGNDSFTAKFDVWATPFFGFGVLFKTSYSSILKTEAGELEAIWLPGDENVRFKIPVWGAALEAMCYNGKRLVITADSLKVKNGKIIAEYSFTDDKDTVTVKVPGGMNGVVLSAMTNTGRITTYYCSSENKVTLPKGQHDFCIGLFIKPVDKEPFVLLSFLNDFKAEESAEIKGIFPLKAPVTNKAKGSIATFSLTLTDASGRRVNIIKGQNPINDPVLLIKDAEDNKVHSEKFEQG